MSGGICMASFISRFVKCSRFVNCGAIRKLFSKHRNCFDTWTYNNYHWRRDLRVFSVQYARDCSAFWMAEIFFVRWCGFDQMQLRIYFTIFMRYALSLSLSWKWTVWLQPGLRYRFILLRRDQEQSRYSLKANNESLRKSFRLPTPTILKIHRFLRHSRFLCSHFITTNSNVYEWSQLKHVFPCINNSLTGYKGCRRWWNSSAFANSEDEWLRHRV